MPQVFFQTFGCQMNVADSHEIGSLLAARGFLTTEDPACADLLIINTCSVREHAEQRAKARIAEFCALKKKGAELWVIGCMAERIGSALKNEIPGISRVVGAKSLDTVSAVIDERYPVVSEDLTGAQSGHAASDFISIMRGCDNFCAYCIVPYVRGREQSLAAVDIVELIKKRAAAGIREVTLLGQNVNSYHDGTTDFPDLLRMVADVDGIERIRFTTSHPKDCSEKLIRTVADIQKCCRHFHLPIQAGSDRVLAAMNRKYTAAAYLDTIEMIRSYLPGADLTTDILVGFPGETETDFQATMEIVRRVRFTTAFMFAYSVREGTAAATLADTVPKSEKLSRLRTLIDVQTSITREIYALMVGKRVDLMISARQEKRDRLWMATDSGCKRALISCNDARAGMILTAKVKSAGGMTLICEEEKV